MADIRFLLRKEEKPTYLGGFDQIDIVLFMASLFALMPLIVFFNVPFGVAVCMTIAPVFLFSLFFRYKKPSGYFTHWLSYQLRPHRWAYLGRATNTLMDLRSRCVGITRPLKRNQGDTQKMFVEPGITIRWVKERSASEPNPFIELVRAERAKKDSHRDFS